MTVATEHRENAVYSQGLPVNKTNIHFLDWGLGWAGHGTL
jgi:hypothetical protein